MALGVLQRFRETGVDPNLVLLQSEFNNWTGLFPLKPAFLEQCGVPQEKVDQMELQQKVRDKLNQLADTSWMDMH